MLSAFRSAFVDIRAGLALKRVWLALATEDIDDQHRRTTLGPIWLLVNYLAFVGTFLVLFGRGSGSPNISAYIAIGLLVWFYMAEVIGASISLFAREEAFIKGTTLPLSVYVLRQSAQSIIRSGYAVIGCLAILLLTGTLPGLNWFSSLPGLILLLVTTPAVIIVCAIGGAFFPDLQFIISNIIRIGLFVTPIFWVYTGDGGIRELFYYWNPFTYFLEVVRTPIVSGVMPMGSLLLCSAICLVLWLLALVLLGLFRKRIVFVL